MKNFTLEDLRPFDWIASHKKPEHWYEEIPDSAILKYGGRICPGGYLRINHIRLVGLRKDGTTPPMGFEWTTPRARKIIVEPWMLTPGYSFIMRRKNVSLIKPELIVAEFDKHDGRLYDYLQLLGMYVGWQWLQFGEKYEVCSTGATEIMENLTGLDLFPTIPRWKIPPCLVVNTTDIWNCMNHHPEHDYLVTTMAKLNRSMYPELEKRKSCAWL